MRRPTISYRIADASLLSELRRTVGGLVLEVDSADADIVVADDDVEGALSPARIGAGALPETVRATVFAVTRALQLAAEDTRDFASSATHEIRNPLGAVTVNLAFALPLTAATADVHDALTDARDAAARVVRLIDDAMFLELAFSGTIRAKLEPLDASALFDGVMENAATSARGRAVTLRVAGVTGEILGDPSVLPRAMSSLVDLALKYSVRGATVEIGLEERALFVRHDARPWDQHPPLRAWNAGRRRPGQLGLALAVAAAAVELARAELVIESDARWPTVMRVLLPT